MKGAVQLGKIADIPIKIHWSFGLLVLFILYIGIKNDLGLEGTLWFAASMMTLFICVLLHEYGHALTARKYGVKTRDIIISPIGGMARLERLPEKPIQEFFVALAGPVVNIVIAIILGFAIFLFFSASFEIKANSLEYLFNGPDFIKLIFWMNLLLCGFNLIPAFPMDGGRILRSLLSIKMGKRKSTRIASFVGKVIAIGFLIAGIAMTHIFLALIGMFVFFMASQEARWARVEEILASFKVSQVFKTEIAIVHPNDNMGILIDQLYRSVARNFVVMENDLVVGCVPEFFVIEARKAKEHDKPVSSYISKGIGETTPDHNILDVYNRMNEEGLSVVLVKENDQSIGYLDRHMIQNLVDTSQG